MVKKKTKIIYSDFCSAFKKIKKKKTNIFEHLVDVCKSIVNNLEELGLPF